MSPSVSDHGTELDRIRAAYEARDAAAASSAYSWSSVGYRFYMQELEWSLLRELDRAGATVAGADVLEVGCGSGYFLHRMQEYGAASASGIDLMDNRIEQARARYPTLDVRAGDAAALPFAAASFDVVTQITCLSSVLDADLRRRIAAEMWRVCRPGGVVVSFDMRPVPGLFSALRRLRARAAGRPAAAGGTPTTPISLDELRSLFDGAELQHRPVMLSFDLGGLATRGRVIAQAAAAIPWLRTHLLAIARKPR
jgi:SAM-dependent methyltransferase